MRVLVVEDEQLLARQLANALAESGYAVDTAGDGARADFLGRTERYDAVVLDLGLPKIDGLTLLRRWRDAGIAVPVLVLTARDSWHEKVEGMDGGADDYVAKPFRVEEVLARLRALIRRASGQVAPELRCGAVVVDPRSAKVSRDGVPVRLTSHEFRVTVVPDAPSRPRRLARRVDRTHLRGERRPRFEYRRSVRGATQAKAGRLLHRDRPRPRVQNRAWLMKPTLSVRWRVLLGASLWTTGLFTVAGVLITSMLLRHPSTPRFFHSLFVHSVPATIVAFACMTAGVWQVRRGLSPFQELREQLASVRAGRDPQVSGRYPAEVQPLVDDLNALLEHRERTVRRALAKAADLAHGLKTPLAVLTQEAALVDAAGHHELAATISEHVERMRRQLDFHLAHARAAASGATPGARCTVAESADALARTLDRLYTDRGTAIRVEVDPHHAVRTQREDLDEMLGNLLDNACKWAASKVTVSVGTHRRRHHGDGGRRRPGNSRLDAGSRPPAGDARRSGIAWVRTGPGDRAGARRALRRSHFSRPLARRRPSGSPPASGNSVTIRLRVPRPVR